MAICGHDGCSWEIAESDALCGYCGRRLASLVPHPERIRLYQGHDRGRFEYAVTFTNMGISAVHAVKVTCPEWTQVAPINDGGVHLEPGQSVQISVVVPPEVLDDRRGRTAAVRVHTNVGTFSLPVEIVPEFDLDVRCEPSELVGRKLHEVTLCLTGTKGSADVESVDVGVAWAKIIGPLSRFKIERESAATLKLAVDTSGLPAGKPQELPLTLKLALRAEPISRQTSLVFREPAELRVSAGPPRKFFDMVEGEEGSSQIWRLRNSGGAALELLKPEIAFTGAPFLELKAPTDEKLKLDPEAITNLEVAASAKGLAPGDYQAVIKAPWIGETAQRQEIVVQATLHVTPLPVKDVAAIDFGTSCSCCSVWDSKGQKYSLVEVDPDGPGLLGKQIAPTTVTYRTDSNDPRGISGWLFGERAFRYGRILGFRDATVAKIKRDIGRNMVKRVVVGAYRYPLRPEEIVADILRYYLERIIWSPSMRARPRDVVVTVPAMFSSFERDAMRSAARFASLLPPRTEKESAAGDHAEQAALEEKRYRGKLALIDEPVAAAASFFFDSEKKRNCELPDTYTLMVCDIGGGTTDICLLRVNDVTQNGQRRLRVQLLAIGGHPTFGGEYITERLALRILEKCRDLVAKDVVLCYDESEHKGDPEYAQAAADNRAKLYDLAEDAKISFSVSSDDVKLRGFELSLPGEKKLVTIPEGILVSAADVKSVTMADVGIVAGMMQGLLEYAKTKHGEKFVDGCPDVLLLTGRTMLLPFVHDALATRFGRRKLAFDSETLKRCVVDGAVRVHQAALRGGTDFRYQRDDNCSCAAIGIAVLGQEKGEMVFESVIKQFGPFNVWHVNEMLLPGMPAVTYDVYESYAPNEMAPIAGNASLRKIGVFSVTIPEDVFAAADAAAERDETLTNFVVKMKLERETRHLAIEVEIKGSSWRESPELEREREEE